MLLLQARSGGKMALPGEDGAYADVSSFFRGGGPPVSQSTRLPRTLSLMPPDTADAKRKLTGQEKSRKKID